MLITGAGPRVLLRGRPEGDARAARSGGDRSRTSATCCATATTRSSRGSASCPKPVVAAVNGPAVGIGCSLALACDLIWAAESAIFGLAFVNIGLVPDGGSTFLVPVAAGKARALEMALLGEPIPAEQALDWGLINRVVPDGELMDEARGLAQRLAQGPDPLLRQLQAGPQQQLPARSWTSSSTWRPTSRARWSKSADFIEGVSGLRREAGPSFQRELAGARRRRPTAARGRRCHGRPYRIARRCEVDPTPPGPPLLVRCLRWCSSRLLAAARHRRRRPADPRGRPDRERAGHRHALQDRLLHRPGGDRPRVGASCSTRCSASGPGAAARRRRSRATRRSSWAGRSAPSRSWSRSRSSPTSSCRRHHATRPRPGPASVAEARRPVRRHQPAAAPGRQGARDPGLRTAVPVALPVPERRRLLPARWWCPRDTTVMLTIKANDVVHRWWIPKLGGKMDAVPGYTNKTWFKATETGTFDGPVRRVLRRRTTPYMTAKVTVVEPRQYQAWVERQKRLIAAGARSWRRTQRAGRSRRRRGEPSERRSMATTRARRRAQPEIIVHGGSPERRAGWIDWVTTTDHKKIGILYLFTTAFFFLVGGVEALLMRIQLGVAGQHVPRPHHLQPALHAARHDDDLHGRRPIAAGFGNYLVPLMIGARDMAFPRLNMLSWWLLVFGGVVLYGSHLLGRRRRPAGRPTRRCRTTTSSPAHGIDAWILGAAPRRDLVDPRRDQLHRRRSTTCARPGMTLSRMPLFVWTILIYSYLIMHRALVVRGDARDAADRPQLRRHVLRPDAGRRRRCCGSTCSGSWATPRSTSWSCPRSGS